jgi:predicted TPR repeat methyltransferase
MHAASGSHSVHARHRVPRHVTASALQVCKSVLALDPAHPRANFKCASALRQLRRQADALLHYRRHLEHFPEDEQARFWVGILTGENVARAPASHVASLFDCYANKFESHLIETLQYRTPDVLMESVTAAADQVGAGQNTPGRYWGCCLDLGCGTGLMGPLLREHVGSLRGVDLSEKMIEKAKEKGLYDELVVDDIERYLKRQADAGNTFELIVAADVLVYLGDLAPLFSEAASVAAPGCLLALSTEQRGGAAGGKQGGSDDGMEWGERGYVATLTGRFQHVKEYVVRAAANAGWSLVSCNEEIIRCNAGQPIAGDVYVFWMQSRR